MPHSILYSLRTRMFCIVAMMLVPGILLTFYMYQEGKKYARIETFEEARRYALLIAGSGKEVIEKGHIVLEAMAKMLPEVTNNPKMCDVKLAEIGKEYPAYEAFSLFDINGDLHCSTAGTEDRINIAEQKWFKRAKEVHAFVVSDPTSNVRGKPVIVLAQPMPAKTDFFQGVITTTMDLGWMERVVKGLNLPLDMTVTVVNRAGTILARHPNNGDWVEKSFPGGHDILVEYIGKGADAVEAKGIDGVERLYAFAPLLTTPGNELYVRVGIPSSLAFAEANRVYRQNLFILIGVGGLALLGTYLFGNVYILRHVNGLLKATSRLADGDLSFRIGMSHNKGELAQLANSFDTMADAIEERNDKVRLAEANYRSIFDNASEGIYRTTPAGRFTLVNASLARIMGYDSPQDVYDSVHDIASQLYVDPRKRIELIRCLQAGKAVENFEIEAYRKDGSKVWVSLAVRSITNDRGDIESIEGFVVDISRRKYAELKLKQSEAKFRAIFEDAPMGIMRSTPEGIYLAANATLAQMYGYDSPEDMIKGVTSIRDQLFVDPGQREEIVRLLEESGEIRNYEARIRRKDGTVIWTTRNMRATRDDEGNILYYDGFTQDITERKRLEEQLLAAKEEAEAANRAKSDFLAKISHDIRTPMNAILGMTDTTLHTSLTAEQRDYLETVKESADHLLLLINDLLDISKIEAKGVVLERIDFNLRHVLYSTMRTLAVQAEAKELCLDLDVDPGVRNYLKGDPARLRQIIINIVGNAIKFTVQGGVQVVVKPGRSGDPAPDEPVILRFTVTDSGVGIAPEAIPGLFDPFRQADGSIARKYGGTGLGLSICKQLIELMGGEIGVGSVPGQGATFTFTARFEPGEPVDDILDDSIPAGKELTPPGAIDVLLVDDNPLNIKVGLNFLKRMGHSVTVASSGERALAALCDKRFDAVLMDVEMPGMDGFEATRRIRQGEGGEKNRSIPIIAMTAHALAGYRERCLEAGMDDYISKPVRYTEMLAILNRMVFGVAADGRTGCLDLPAAAGIVDTAQALERMGGDRELLRVVTRKCLDGLPVSLAAMRQAAEDADFGRLRFLAHGVKGNLRTIGAGPCAGLAADLEDAAVRQDVSAVLSLLDRLAGEMDQVRTCLI